MQLEKYQLKLKLKIFMYIYNIQSYRVTFLLQTNLLEKVTEYTR